jgi:hypothetical protein
MDDLTACEIADVQGRWNESGNPAMGGLWDDIDAWGANAGIWAKGTPQIQREAEAERERMRSTAKKLETARLPTPSIRTPGIVADFPMDEDRPKTKTETDELKSKSEKKEDSNSELSCLRAGGIWDSATSVCARSVNKPDYTPWIVAGGAGVLLLFALMTRR